MRNVILAVLSAAIVLFSGCSSKSVGPATGLEGTEVSTYLIGEHMSVKDVTSKLESAGFEIVAKYQPVKKGTTIVYTNAALKAEAAKTGRAYIAVQRVFVDDKEKMISFTNPVYYGKAFMQDQYDHAVFNAQLEKINATFQGLKQSADKWKFDGLADYHFMVGMPYYDGQDEVGKGTNEELLAKAKAYKKGKELIFELKLSDTSTLLGYKLGKRTEKFVEKVGRANASILPYCVSVESGTAKALSAKYYIAISYPLLDLGGFATIMTVPGAVIDDLKKPFK